MILDYRIPIKLRDEARTKYGNELNSLRYLASGLRFLNSEIEKIEKEVCVRELQNTHAATKIEEAVRAQGTGKIQGFTWGNHPLLEGLSPDMNLVSCFFHWYAVSVCNYVRLVEWLWRQVSPSASRPSQYVEMVLPEVKPWRDKVAAHFAGSSYNKADNAAERKSSVFPPVAFSGDRFVAQPMMVTVIISDEQSTTANLSPWSLTRVHDDLKTRYWPEHGQSPKRRSGSKSGDIPEIGRRCKRSAPTLLVEKLRLEKEMPGLAARKPLEDLSEKRITMKVREVLRQELGRGNISVSCYANLNKSRKEWSGYLMRSLKPYKCKWKLR